MTNLKTDFKYARDIVYVLEKSHFGNYLDTKYFYTLEDAREFEKEFNAAPAPGLRGKTFLLEPYEI